MNFRIFQGVFGVFSGYFRVFSGSFRIFQGCFQGVFPYALSGYALWTLSRIFGPKTPNHFLAPSLKHFWAFWLFRRPAGSVLRCCICSSMPAWRGTCRLGAACRHAHNETESAPELLLSVRARVLQSRLQGPARGARALFGCVLGLKWFSWSYV